MPRVQRFWLELQVRADWPFGMNIGEPNTGLRQAVSCICHVADHQTRGSFQRLQMTLHLTHFFKWHPSIQTQKCWIRKQPQNNAFINYSLVEFVLQYETGSPPALVFCTSLCCCFGSGGPNQEFPRLCCDAGSPSWAAASSNSFKIP